MTTYAPPPKNYLSNREILREIHKSKTSYCWFADKSYADYDCIIENGSDLDVSQSLQQAREMIDVARTNRASRMNVEPETISDTDLIFRVMCWDHVPMMPKVAPRRKPKPTQAQDIFTFDDDELIDDVADAQLGEEARMHVRVNFPPFKHFKLGNDGQFEIVGQSHWKGDLQTGCFSVDHGQITNGLAKVYLLLAEKYALRFNWRNYSYRDEMQASAVLQLTMVGLRFNESKGSNPFAYLTTVVTNAFCRVLNNEKRSQNLRDDLLETAGLNPSWSRTGTSVTTVKFDE